MSALSLDQELDRLLERYRANPEGRIFAPLADCYRKLGRLGEALRVCESGLGRHPNYSSALVILGKIHLDRGDELAARGAFERVLEIDPHNLVALRHLARAAETDGDAAGALDLWQRVVALDAHQPEAKDHIERLLRGTQGPQRAAAEPAATEPAAAEPGVAEPAATEPEGAELAPAEPAPVEPAMAETHAPEPRAPERPAAWPLAEPERVEREPTPSEAQVVERPAGATSGRQEEGTTSAAIPASARRDDAERARRQASQIATMTLADIYYEQGFKAKALDIYRTIHRQSPETPGLAEKVRRIEAELTQIQGRLGPASADLPATEEPDTSAYEEGVLSAGIAEDSEPEPPPEPSTGAERPSMPHPEPEAARPETAEPADEASPPPRPGPAALPLDDEVDFNHFRNWLGRIKARPL